MSLVTRKSALFLADFDAQFRWYENEAGWEVACRYLLAVDQTLEKLAERPDLGCVRHFEHPDLQDLRSFRVEPPFHRRLIFYRHDNTVLDVVRVMHGARDLSRRLLQPPGVEDHGTD